MTPFEARLVLDNHEIELFVKLYAKVMSLDLIHGSDNFMTLNSKDLTTYQNASFYSHQHQYGGLLSNIIQFDNEFIHTWKSKEDFRIWFDLHRYIVE